MTKLEQLKHDVAATALGFSNSPNFHSVLQFIVRLSDEVIRLDAERQPMEGDALRAQNLKLLEDLDHLTSF